MKNGGCFVPGTPVRLSTEQVVVAVSGGAKATTTVANASPLIATTAIENVALGARVPDQNPRPEDYDFSFGDVDQSAWKQIDVRLRRNDGALVEMQLLRPESWIERKGLVIGGKFTPRLSEIEIDGSATITAITACPEIMDSEGSVVTGRFVTRQVNNLIEVTLENGTTFTGTATHPVWIPTYEEWVKLGDVEVGQELESLSGLLAVVALTRLTNVSDVFNIEVHGHHVYRITEDGVLVHNNCFEEIVSGLTKGAEQLLEIGKSTAKLKLENGVLKVSDIYVQGDSMLDILDSIRKVGKASGAKNIEVTAEFLNFPLRDRLVKMGLNFEKIGEGPFGDIWKITGGL